MSKEERKVPELRFKGFHDDWEHRELWKEYKIIMGQSPNSQNYTSNSEDYILVQGNADISNGWVKPRVWTTQVTKMANKGAIILSVRAPVGEVGKTQYPIVLGRGVAGIEGDEFVFQLLIKMKNDFVWRRLSTGSTFDSINSKDLKSIRIFTPKEPEKVLIGQYLEKLDQIVNLHQRSHNMLNQKKQVLLRKMFPSLREDIPSIRFNSFEQDWKLSNLGDLGEVLTGNTPSTNMESYWEKGKNGYIWITPSDISKYKTSESMRYLSEEGWKKARKVPENSVLITSIASIGKNTINQMPAAFNQQINAIIPKENSAYFILTCMEKNKVQFSSIAGKTATPIINKTDFKKFKVKVPQHPEQLVVGDLFEKIDDILSYYQKKLDVLKKIKSIYLSKMFL